MFTPESVSDKQSQHGPGCRGPQLLLIGSKHGAVRCGRTGDATEVRGTTDVILELKEVMGVGKCGSLITACERVCAQAGADEGRFNGRIKASPIPFSPSERPSRPPAS